jgi:hypothetical protein
VVSERGLFRRPWTFVRRLLGGDRRRDAVEAEDSETLHYIAEPGTMVLNEEPRMSPPEDS